MTLWRQGCSSSAIDDFKPCWQFDENITVSHTNTLLFPTLQWRHPPPSASYCVVSVVDLPRDSANKPEPRGNGVSVTAWAAIQRHTVHAHTGTQGMREWSGRQAERKTRREAEWKSWVKGKYTGEERTLQSKKTLLAFRAKTRSKHSISAWALQIARRRMQLFPEECTVQVIRETWHRWTAPAFNLLAKGLRSTETTCQGNISLLYF